MIQTVKQRKIPAQKELLLLCARRTNEDTESRIRALVDEGLDWAELLVSAAENGMAPLFCQRLETWAGDVLPPLWRDLFREEFAANARRNLFLSSELLRVLDAFDSCGIRATPYKGPVLAVQAYDDIALRQFADLDIVVPQAEIREAHGALVDLGFRAVNPTSDPQISRQIPGQYSYSNEVHGTQIELHTEATLRYVPVRLDLAPLLARREAISLGNRELQTFSAEDSLVLLAVHGSKHFWDRLGWIADIAALGQTSRGLDWELALARARSVGAERMVLLGAGLAHDLLGAPLTGAVAIQLKQDAVTRRLKDDIARQYFAERPLQLSVFRRFAFRSQTSGAGRNGLVYALRLALTPTEEDRTGRPTSSCFEPLYTLFRLRRLAGLYGWRTRISKIPPVAIRRELPIEIAQELLAFAYVRPDDFVLDMLTESGQIAIMAARNFGTAGVGVVPSQEAFIRAKIDARAQGVLERVRFIQRAPYEGPDAAGSSRATILFIDPGILGNDGFQMWVEAAMSRGMRVVSIGGHIVGRSPFRENNTIDGHGGEVITFRLWQAVPEARPDLTNPRSLVL